MASWQDEGHARMVFAEGVEPAIPQRARLVPAIECEGPDVTVARHLLWRFLLCVFFFFDARCVWGLDANPGDCWLREELIW